MTQIVCGYAAESSTRSVQVYQRGNEVLASRAQCSIRGSDLLDVVYQPSEEVFRVVDREYQEQQFAVYYDMATAIEEHV